MKKNYFFVLFVLAATLAAQAQTSKGGMMIGGTVSIESTNNQDDSKSRCNNFLAELWIFYF
jgi:hypothetical protein